MQKHRLAVLWGRERAWWASVEGNVSPGEDGAGSLVSQARFPAQLLCP